MVAIYHKSFNFAKKNSCVNVSASERNFLVHGKGTPDEKMQHQKTSSMKMIFHHWATIQFQRIYQTINYLFNKVRGLGL